MRSKRAVLNLIASLVELLIATISSFVVPHYIIRAYGSSVNGLISSITQFLSYIALIESGIGAIGRAALYKPLAEKDNQTLSSSVNALENFYRKISYVFVIYVLILSALFPLLISNEFSWAYVAALIVILAFSTFIQYYFGITCQTVIQADQKKYIPSLLQAMTLLLNMVITVVLIKLGASIHAVKIGSAAAYAIRPMILYSYVKNHYKIDKSEKPKNEILKQRYDGLAHHIAFFIHKNTDIAVLTILANIKEVSVYSVYMLAVSGCSKVVNIFSSSLEPAFGNMIAKKEYDTLKDRVGFCSTISFQISIILFSTAAIVISPFVELYTRGVNDVNYLRPAFGIIMLIAEGIYCVRLPYQAAVYAAGRFKETRNGAIIEATVNIVISVILVFRFGLIGVAIGTLVSMLIRTVQYIWFYNVKLLGDANGLRSEILRLLVSIIEVITICLIASHFPAIPHDNYIQWITYSLFVGVLCTIFVLLVSVIAYRKELHQLGMYIKSFSKKLTSR